MLKHLVFIALFLLSASVFATAEEFIVQKIAVDVTDESAVQAQEQAFATAEIAAFQSLMQKMVSPQDLATVPAATPDQLKAFITSFSVQDEKRSDVRYMANLQYRFDSAAVRNFLQANNITFSESLAHPVLIVPFMDQSHGEELQDLWQKAWDKVDYKKYDLPFISTPSTVLFKEFSLDNHVVATHLRALKQKHKTPHVALIHFKVEPTKTIAHHEKVETNETAEPNENLEAEESTMTAYLDIYPSALTQPDYTIAIPIAPLKDISIEKLTESIHQGLSEIEKFHLAEKQEDQSLPKQTLELIIPTHTLSQWHRNLHIIQSIQGLLVQRVKSISKANAHIIGQTSDLNHITQQFIEKGFQVESSQGYLTLLMPHEHTQSA